MPSYKGQGQSRDTTEWKERGIAAALSINLSIFARRYRNSRWAKYQHFDLNAGEGVNTQVNCIGSPLAFIQTVDELNLTNYRAYFVDIDRAIIEALHSHEAMSREQCILFHGDNKSIIYAIPELIRLSDKPEMAIGSVLVDPNGSEVNIEALAWLSEQCPKLDFIINWNSVIFKRLQGAHGSLEAAIAVLGKKHWLIRKPTGGQGFTLLIGRNMLVGDHRTMGFHHLQSDLGQEIFHACNLTRTENNRRIASVQKELQF